MQVEAACAAAAAVMELLAHTSGGVTRLFPAIPAEWSEASFEGLRVEGGFLVSAVMARGLVTEVRVKSERGGQLRLRNPFPGQVRSAPDGASLSGDILELQPAAGEEWILAAEDDQRLRPT
jgi:alpha-L-fucosidase 2